MIILLIVLLTINTTNMFLHLFGCYLLTMQQMKTKIDSPRELFLINLSITEFLKNVIFAIANPLLGIISVEDMSYILTANWVFNLVYYFSMTFITVDRLLCAILNLKYRLYCTFRIGVYIVTFQWVVGFIVLIISYRLHLFNDFAPYDGKLVISFSSAYLIFAFITYVTIFGVFRKSRRRTQSQHQSQMSSFQLFRRSKFWVSCLLITSYLFFVTIPDIGGTLKLVVFGTGDRRQPYIIAIWSIFRGVSDFCDWCIYVFAVRTIRKLLLLKLSCFSNLKRKRRIRQKEHLQKKRKLMKVKMLSSSSSLEPSLSSTTTKNSTRMSRISKEHYAASQDKYKKEHLTALVGFIHYTVVDVARTYTMKNRSPSKVLLMRFLFQHSAVMEQSMEKNAQKQSNINIILSKSLLDDFFEYAMKLFVESPLKVFPSVEFETFSRNILDNGFID